MIEHIRARLAARRRLEIPEDQGYPAAVLLLLYEADGDYHVVLTARTSRVEHHKNEVSFPGGARDPGDADALATALRETEEEIGVRPEDVEVLGTLDDLITITKFRVTPFVGRIPYPYEFRPNSFEVDRILEVPLRHLLDAANHFQDERDREGVRVRTRSYRFGDYVIWGATARMLRQFLGVVYPESEVGEEAVAEAVAAESEPLERVVRDSDG